MEEKLKGQEDIKKQIQETDRVAEKTAAQRAAYNAKFTEFSEKYDKKNEWYQKNIIQPQIERHLDDFEKEKIYLDQFQ